MFKGKTKINNKGVTVEHKREITKQDKVNMLMFELDINNLNVWTDLQKLNNNTLEKMLLKFQSLRMESK